MFCIAAEFEPSSDLRSFFQKSSDSHKRILHTRDLSSGTQKAVRSFTSSRDATVRASPVPKAGPPTVSPSFNPRTSRPRTPLGEPVFERYMESENEDYSDAFDDRAVLRARGNQRLELTKKLSSKSWVRCQTFHASKF